jgi:hypothetical protein
MRHDNNNPVDYVDKCYYVDMYKMAYGNIVYPCRDRSEWEKTACPTILPPHYVKHVGRPIKARRRAPGEIDARSGGRRITRHGLIIHCSYYGEPDHNRGSCKWWKAGLVPPNASNLSPQPT